MKSYLFDTMVHVAATRGRVPEKWRRQWDEVKAGRKYLLLFEPLIAEMFYRMAEAVGEEAALTRILWLKSLRSAKLVKIDDRVAVSAARIFSRFRRYGISLVDAFSVAVAKREGAKLFTTDLGVRNVCRKADILVSFLPREELL